MRCTARAQALGDRLGKDGEPREVYVYHVVDNAWSMKEFGHQASCGRRRHAGRGDRMMATGAWYGPA